MVLLPLLLLFALALAGSVKVVALAQAKTALESRLDVCAVQLAVERERSLQRLTALNDALRVTVTGIYVARGAMLAGPAAVVAGASLPVLLSANRALALLEEGLLATQTAAELRHHFCAADHFSGEPALCVITPTLVGALRRKKTLFADVSGPYVHWSESETLAGVRCTGDRWESTKLAVHGDPDLAREKFADTYEP